LAASWLRLFVNPFGYKLVLYPFDFLFRQPSNMKHIAEWHSVDFSTGDGKLALFMILALLAAALFSRRRWRLDEVLLTAFALWAGCRTARLLFFRRPDRGTDTRAPSGSVSALRKRTG
jgi:hypothetical protein